MSQSCWRVYPPPAGKHRAVAVGDDVFFRPKSAKERGRRGRVIEEPKETEPSTENNDTSHAWVQFSKESTETANKNAKCVSRKRLFPILSPSPPKSQQQRRNFPSQTIVVTPETIPYRLLASSQICDTDHILEIGCSTGEASSGLVRYGQSWVGFDTSEDMIEQCLAHVKSSIAVTNESKQSFHATRMDAFSDPNGALEIANKFSDPTGPTAVFLDIGGNREEDGVLNMMVWVLTSFPNLRLLVVKSRELAKDMLAAAKPEGGPIVDHDSGLVETGSDWFDRKVKETRRSTLPSHPLQAPLVYSPADNLKPICRYHNYHPKGCSKESRCLYDHDHCHRCLRKGHTAINCDKRPTT